MSAVPRRTPIRLSHARTRLRLVKATYRVANHNRLIRRWHTADAGKVPSEAHPRHELTRDGRLRLVGYDELMCQHAGDFSRSIESAEANLKASVKHARREVHA